MSKLKPVRKLSFAALLLSAALLAGCGGGGGRINGTYASEGLSIKFESGKAYMTGMAGTVQVAYEVDGDKVILKSPQGNLVLTRNEDGTLDGPGGTLKKTDSGS